MSDSKTKEYICTNCKNSVNSNEKYCLHCGDIFDKDLFCMKHSFTKAQGVCVICKEPCCEKCGEMVKNIYFCFCHNKYEVMEGMVNLYSNSNEINIKYVYQLLKQNDLQPFLFYSGRRPISLDYSLMSNLISKNERKSSIIKLMIPFNKFIQAEEILKDLEIL